MGMAENSVPIRDVFSGIDHDNPPRQICHPNLEDTKPPKPYHFMDPSTKDPEHQSVLFGVFRSLGLGVYKRYVCRKVSMYVCMYLCVSASVYSCNVKM